MDGQKLVGIVNLTPDSFSDGGQYSQTDQSLKRIETLIQDGADIIDIGAESTRPGAEPVSVSEEIKRLEPLLKVYQKHFDIPLSLDTYKSEVAAVGLSYGVDIINDISSLTADPQMAPLIGKYGASVILMHKQGLPNDMQDNPTYQHVMKEIKLRLNEAIAIAKSNKIEKIIIDPGIGFGKSLEHNLTILNQLESLHDLNYPILIGTSRKSFIGDLTGEKVADRLPGTIASCVLAVQKGVQFLRVHDVKAVKQAMQITNAILNQRRRI